MRKKGLFYTRAHGDRLSLEHTPDRDTDEKLYADLGEIVTDIFTGTSDSPEFILPEPFDFDLEISKLVKVFPDGRKVKSRPEDEVYIRVKMGHMAPLEVTTFGMGTYVGTFTREELQEVLDYGYDEVEKLVDIERTGGA